MSDRCARRGAGAPFYAPPRRKTSAEIISEARAAIYGEMSGASSGASSGVLRPLRTRRPFTPREPQRTLFHDRARKKEARPPSAFDMKYLSLAENGDDISLSGSRITEGLINGIQPNEPQVNVRKKPSLNKQSRSVQERSSGDGWSGFTKLPHLNGKSKPLHQRNNVPYKDDKPDVDLVNAISITQAMGGDNITVTGFSNDNHFITNTSPDANTKRKSLAYSLSYDSGNGRLGDIGVKHIAVQLPNTTCSDFSNMTILELSEALSQRNRDVDHTVQLMEALQRLIEQTTPSCSLRELVLRSLYVHIDSDNEKVLVAIARAMLTLRVTGKHLTAACKLVFKIAKNDSNDHFFRNTNLLELLVEGCGRADPLQEGECCVYGAGALRFLALEPRLCELAHKAGALHLAALHLKILNNAKAENPRSVKEQSNHALYQLTGTFRNLAGGGEHSQRAFVSSGALDELVTALLHHTDRDVLTNVARCLSVLSAEETCCEWLCASPTSSGALLQALAACAARAPLAVRLAYTLGNMAAAGERARLNIYNEQGGVDVLLTILESYTKRNEIESRETDDDPDFHLIGSDLGGSDGSNEDVLIKTFRVLANLCLAERVGRGLAEIYAERIIKVILACLEFAEKPFEEMGDYNEEEAEKYKERREELTTAVLATLNNITFYRDPPSFADPLGESLDQLCIAACRWLIGSGPAACEAVRSLGNLTRCARAAQRLVVQGGVDLLTPFLLHEDVSVRCAAAGVLVNVCGCGAAGAAGGRAAARALAVAARAGDASLAALLARALWNAHAHAPLDAPLANQAAAALAMFIEDESVFAACECPASSERRASESDASAHQVKFVDNNNHLKEPQTISKSCSVDQELNLNCDKDTDDEANGYSGEDLGFEDGDLDEGCDCAPCRRLADWEELVGVAIPLLEQLKPPKTDASVGTD